MRPRIFLMFALSLPLAACVSRDQADARLARGCTAAAELFLPEGITLKTIKKRTFGPSDQDPSLRNVTLTAVETDGWSDEEKEYRCTFAESFGFSGSYTAAIEQLRIGDNIYGKEKGKILGSFDDHLKLTEAVQKAINAPGP
ncbi:MAG: hypothetical protein H6862_02535 [Rhodospirillales bacterium]|nr:hypothetical protein [Rhodospirillales bacterium]